MTERGVIPFLGSLTSKPPAYLHDLELVLRQFAIGTNMATGVLTVKDGRVVDKNGTSVILRGVGLGGWMK